MKIFNRIWCFLNFHEPMIDFDDKRLDDCWVKRKVITTCRNCSYKEERSRTILLHVLGNRPEYHTHL